HDEKGIIFPKTVAPYDIYLIDIKSNGEAEKVYEMLQGEGYEVLFDDREKTPGEKFSDADLMGIPLRVVVSEKTLKEGAVEIKKRSEETIEMVKINEINNFLKEC
ncbi:MAG: His/Gly/Thr/Pro-type tRNA ligase C-terminal domain-containing protein, partial [Candidatus Pacebacteria bacterium]|nr:His/Gly/Thr/Pro-type tRNA ligase C-terminal domain-containing protein [Candidatus Paceibacterota bacterium]